jgi:hypothetical protein
MVGNTVHVFLHVLYVPGLSTLNATYWTKRPTGGISVSNSYSVIITEMQLIFLRPAGQSYHYIFFDNDVRSFLASTIFIAYFMSLK